MGQYNARCEKLEPRRHYQSRLMVAFLWLPSQTSLTLFQHRQGIQLDPSILVRLIHWCFLSFYALDLSLEPYLMGNHAYHTWLYLSAVVGSNYNVHGYHVSMRLNPISEKYFNQELPRDITALQTTTSRLQLNCSRTPPSRVNKVYTVTMVAVPAGPPPPSVPEGWKAHWNADYKAW